MADIPGAFMQADVDETVHMLIAGRMAELWFKIDPEMYEPYLSYEKAEKVLYLKLLKALLWYGLCYVTVLGETVCQATGVGLCSKCIWPMHDE
jgi:hypothetical protein